MGSGDQSRLIETLIASGQFASASDVVQDGLKALQARGAAIETWLREEVVPVHNAMQLKPGRARTAEQVDKRIRAHHAARLEQDIRGA